jgi:CO dehydrogenase/acetyl-CoA synthase beta subunit
MMRVLPGRQSIWCRVHRDSLARGLDARVVGGALCAAVRELPFVHAARVVLVTAGDDALAELRPLADHVLEVSTALARMHETAMGLDCDDCEFQEVCDSVEELRRIHTRLAEDKEDEE